MVDANSARRVDAGHVLQWGYAVLVLAAGARSLVQLATHPNQALLAYLLSAAAAVIYAAGWLCIRRVRDDGAVRAAVVCICFEFGGVIVVGATTVLMPRHFPQPTVWSYFGAGYVFAPLALPVAALLWLRGHTQRTGSRAPTSN